MKVIPQRSPFILALVLMVALLASCSKEELVQPCGEASGMEAKSNGSVEGGSANEANSGANGDTNTEDSGISDDGDDLSGSERNKRKKTS